jgi:hypothetical protein
MMHLIENIKLIQSKTKCSGAERPEGKAQSDKID